MFGKKELFDLKMNRTGKGQIFHCNANGDAVVVNPGGVIDSNLYDDGAGILTPIDNFLDQMDSFGEKRFYLQRTFSLGDMLMMLPLYRNLIKLGYEPYIRTKDTYLDLLSSLKVYNEDSKNPAKGLGVNLDYVVERDHWDKNLQKMHRINIYHQVFGLMPNRDDLDFSYDPSRFPVNTEETSYVVFQGRGAVGRRGLSTETIQDLLFFMGLDNIRVIYIGENINELKVFPTNERWLTDLRFMKGNIKELFTLIANAKMLISMDSAPLWISHFTETPVLALLGPSRTQERVALHPLYPEGAEGIRLEQEIGCAPCFEQSEKCEHRFDCMKNVPSERIYELIRPMLLKFWSV